MRVGIEAKWLFDGPPSGRRVVHNLVRSLAAALDDDELHLFLDERARHDTRSVGVPCARRHYVWAGNNQLSNLLVVPRLADRLGLDVVVYQNFVPPRRTTRHARIAFVHDAIFETHPQFFTARERLYFSTLRRLTSSADRVCTVSQSERRRLAQYGYAAADLIDVVPNAVDHAFVPRERVAPELVDGVLRALGIADPFVLYVGRLNARKNVTALVRALAHVNVAGLTLVLAGRADRTAPDVLALAAQCGVADRVRVLGPVADDELRVLYASASVFCFPSFDEGFGLSPLEAMASGTPVVASNIPALVETCGTAALFVDPDDPHSIAVAIDTLLRDPGRRAALRQAGLRRARSFAWSASARRLLASIRAAVRSRPRS